MRASPSRRIRSQAMAAKQEEPMTQSLPTGAGHARVEALAAEMLARAMAARAIALIPAAAPARDRAARGRKFALLRPSHR